jgi:hypothetical protein
MQAMDGLLLDIKREKIEILRSLFPEVVSEDKIDWERLRATPGQHAIFPIIRNIVISDFLSINTKSVIMLDRLFENNDQLKTNTYLQFKDAGVDFRTV